jgi:hypothetical protein
LLARTEKVGECLSFNVVKSIFCSVRSFHFLKYYILLLY